MEWELRSGSSDVSGRALMSVAATETERKGQVQEAPSEEKLAAENGCISL